MNTSDQKVTIKTLQKRNEILHPKLPIVRAHWPKSAHFKYRSSLILELVDIRAANKLVDKGFLVGLQDCVYSQFHRALRFTWCFCFQQYGYVTKQCKAKVRCANCVGSHSTKVCKTQQRRKCTVCKGNRRALSSKCQTRAGALQRKRHLRDVFPLQLVMEWPAEQRKPARLATTVHLRLTLQRLVTTLLRKFQWRFLLLFRPHNNTDQLLVRSAQGHPPWLFHRQQPSGAAPGGNFRGRQRWVLRSTSRVAGVTEEQDQGSRHDYRIYNQWYAIVFSMHDTR